MPIDAILFGGRRASVVPLVFQSRDWEHGVFLGSIMASETTAAAAGAVGNLRRDPFAMLPFCGYNMADYFAHWLEIGAVGRPGEAARRSSTSTGSARTRTARWLWPGYGENSRVLEWVFERVSGTGEAIETPIGFVPAPGAIDTDGLDVSADRHGEAAHRGHRRVAGRGAEHPRALRHLRRQAARPQLRRRGRPARAAAGLSRPERSGLRGGTQRRPQLAVRSRTARRELM